MFETVIVSLYVIGALMAAAFVFTWYPLAFRALAHHRRDVSFIRIIDYAGLHLFVLISFLLILRTFYLYGMTQPQDGVAVVARLLLPFGLDVLIGLRLYKWVGKLWAYRHGGGDDEMLSGVSKGSWRPDDIIESIDGDLIG